MTWDERVDAVLSHTKGLTDRQAAFLVTVMLYSGVCMDRQYCAFASIPHGRKTTDFFRLLVERRYAAVHTCRNNSARVFHVRFKPLYAAIGDPDSKRGGSATRRDRMPKRQDGSQRSRPEGSEPLPQLLREIDPDLLQLLDRAGDDDDRLRVVTSFCRCEPCNKVLVCRDRVQTINRVCWKKDDASATKQRGDVVEISGGWCFGDPPPLHVVPSERCAPIRAGARHGCRRE